MRRCDMQPVALLKLEFAVRNNYLGSALNGANKNFYLVFFINLHEREADKRISLTDAELDKLHAPACKKLNIECTRNTQKPCNFIRCGKLRVNRH